MMTDRRTYRWLWSCLITGGLLLAGCADRSDELPLSSPEPQPAEEQGCPLILQSVTRTDGATELEDANTKIKVFLTSADEKLQTGFFTYATGTGWTSNLTVKEERQYYLYGYMPDPMTRTTSGENDTIVVSKPEGGKYSDGVDIKMTGLPSITTEDVSVVVGVQRVDGIGTNTPDVTEGDFSYVSGIWGLNYVNLLMAHIYAGLELNFKLDADYAKLRSIHLKTITLSTNYGQVDATVQLRQGKGIEQATFTKVESSSASAPVEILSAESAETVLDERYTVTSLSINKLAYCFPSIFSAEGATLSITTTYDVYDRTKNTNLGERTSTNRLRITASAIQPGQKKRVILTVQPTYLYILSDGDLDNPVITGEIGN